MHPPDFFKVALFDHHMPVLDGLGAAKRIRKLESERGIKARLDLSIPMPL